MNANPVALLDESQCQGLESFLADRIYEFNSQMTSFFDGRLLAGSICNDAGEVIAGFSRNTWGGCCEISHLWVIETMRGHGLGRRLLEAAEAEALRRGCEQVVLSTHSFQAPEFYKRLGYQEVFAIVGRPRGHFTIIYIKQFRREHEPSGI